MAPVARVLAVGAVMARARVQGHPWLIAIAAAAGWGKAVMAPVARVPGVVVAEGEAAMA